MVVILVDLDNQFSTNLSSNVSSSTQRRAKCHHLGADVSTSSATIQRNADGFETSQGQSKSSRSKRHLGVDFRTDRSQSDASLPGTQRRAKRRHRRLDVSTSSATIQSSTEGFGTGQGQSDASLSSVPSTQCRAKRRRLGVDVSTSSATIQSSAKGFGTGQGQSDASLSSLPGTQHRAKRRRLGVDVSTSSATIQTSTEGFGTGQGQSNKSLSKRRHLGQSDASLSSLPGTQCQTNCHRLGVDVFTSSAIIQSSAEGFETAQGQSDASRSSLHATAPDIVNQVNDDVVGSSEADSDFIPSSGTFELQHFISM